MCELTRCTSTNRFNSFALLLLPLFPLCYPRLFFILVVGHLPSSSSFFPAFFFLAVAIFTSLLLPIPPFFTPPTLFPFPKSSLPFLYPRPRLCPVSPGPRYRSSIFASVSSSSLSVPPPSLLPFRHSRSPTPSSLNFVFIPTVRTFITLGEKNHGGENEQT